MSRPADPASLRKHVEYPAYLIGSCVSGLSNHSSECSAEIGCSDVAIRYFSSSDAMTCKRWFHLVATIASQRTLYNSSSNCSSCAVLLIWSLFIINGG